MKNKETIKKLVQSELGDIEFQLLPINRKSSNELLRAILDNGKQKDCFYIKDFSSRSDGKKRLLTELETSNILRRETDLPIPETRVIIDENAAIYCLVQKEVGGIPLADIITYGSTLQKREAVNQAAVALSKIHSIKPKVFGEVLFSGLRYSNWNECFTTDINKTLIECSQKGILTDYHWSYFQDKLRLLPEEDELRSCLNHGDFLTHNILINEERSVVSGIIDFELARFWIPEWDLCHIAAISFSVAPELTTIFLQRYTKETGVDETNMELKIDFYSPFESLNFWLAKWGTSLEMTKFIKQDIERVTSR